MKLQVKFRIGSSPDMYSSTLDLVRSRTALLIVDMQSNEPRSKLRGILWVLKHS